MKLSVKKQQELYNLIQEEIMKSRIEIWKMKDDENISIHEIDIILSSLCFDAPEIAVNYLTGKIKKL